MEQKQLLRIYGFLALLFIIFTVTPWYVTINKPTVSNETIHLNKETKLSKKVRLAIDNDCGCNEYYKSKTYTVTKAKSLIPYVYKDSTVTNVGYFYTN